ncbi:BA14K family protein [Pinisolibacter aquiterrae]|uniref:BA14K family protein n=1 Tax=Pinisolibacter aquiterrae TaxID=2815579 RepID=UPI001E3EF46B|nr:BA14K family protein [Pinisolibacter aquiterrae]MCC8235699.1 BA14K family protein [Pinisolibacter aquiterrae]
MRISTRIAAVFLAATVGLMPAVASAQTFFPPVGAAPGGRPGPGPGVRPGGPGFHPGGPGVRPGGPGFRPGGTGMHRPPPPRYYGGRYYRDDGWDPGAAAAAGIIGLAVGAIAAGAASQAATDDGHVDRCLRRYRSYDPSTDAYRGYDGRLHRCRL